MSPVPLQAVLADDPEHPPSPPASPPCPLSPSAATAAVHAALCRRHLQLRVSPGGLREEDADAEDDDDGG